MPTAGAQEIGEAALAQDMKEVDDTDCYRLRQSS
jgi:hypothetical protein